MNQELLQAVREWFHSKARRFPWSDSKDPYAVWISEVMLQQTVVTAAIAPYTRWMARWPTLAALAASPESEVLAAWEGLGYASRARNLHRAACRLVASGKLTLPADYEELRCLPGIGDYTASALLAFAFDLPALTLDANLKRVFLRLGAEAQWTSDIEARWRALWATLIDGPISKASNLGIMQLGQLVCTARNPVCGECPLASACLSRERGLTASIPAAKERTVTEKATVVGVFWRGEQFWLARPLKGRFSTLWLFPPLEPVKTPGRTSEGARNLTTRVHTYTRYKDTLSPLLIPWPESADPPLLETWTGSWMTPTEATGVAMASVYRRILDEAKVLVGTSVST